MLKDTKKKYFGFLRACFAFLVSSWLRREEA
jgi:hypothetical protein